MVWVVSQVSTYVHGWYYFVLSNLLFTSSSAMLCFSADLPGQPAWTGTYRVFPALHYVFTLPGFVDQAGSFPQSALESPRTPCIVWSNTSYSSAQTFGLRLPLREARNTSPILQRGARTRARQLTARDDTDIATFSGFYLEYWTSLSLYSHFWV